MIDIIKRQLPKWDDATLVNKLEFEVLYYGVSKDRVAIITLEEQEILRRMNVTTKLVCDIMSTVACAIAEDNASAACEHLQHILSLQKCRLDTDALVEHLRTIVSLLER